MGGRNGLGVCMRDENHFVIVRALNLASILRGWSELTRFQSRRLDFSVDKGTFLFFVMGLEMTWF